MLRVKSYVMIFEVNVFLCLDLQMFSGRIQLTNDCVLGIVFSCDFVKQKLSERLFAVNFPMCASDRVHNNSCD